MNNIKALLFDKDGTLFDFAATWEAWAGSLLMRLSQGDVARATFMGQAIGFDLQSTSFSRDSIVIAGTAAEVTAALAPHVPQMTQQVLLATLNDEAGQAPQQEAVPLIPLLTSFRAQGLALGIATNDAEAPARAHLDAARVTHLFDFIAGSDSGFGGKPAPGQLLAFAQTANLPPQEVAMIGDSAHDMIAGKAAGMKCVAVLTGLADQTDLAPYADVVLPDIGHLPDWLNGTGLNNP